MSFVDVIARKRDGHVLSAAEIEAFVVGVTEGTVPDYQASALLMAIVLRGMTDDETALLTDAMVRSGERVDLSDIPGLKVGKHSTGGVGDKVSIVLAPLAAACGVIVPKMSGRGLGHTGGTIDKLESIPGFRVTLSVAEMKAALRDVGTCLIGQTSMVAPADKALYALRDVTATIESIPLISASIMSKKIAEGSDALVLDVKCGAGAFMKTLAPARALAESMIAIGGRAGVRTEALITEMEAPLGAAVGNALEIVECIATLKGHGPPDLTEMAIRLATRMVVLANIERDDQAADARVRRTLSSGQALERWRQVIARQGGDPRIVDDQHRLPRAPHRAAVTASRTGYVAVLDAERLGRAGHALGAGRTRTGEAIDHAVGLVVRVPRGGYVAAGEAVIEVHHRDGHGLAAALSLCADAIAIEEQPRPRAVTVLAEVR